jgi:hypothetical protein
MSRYHHRVAGRRLLVLGIAVTAALASLGAPAASQPTRRSRRRSAQVSGKVIFRDDFSQTRWSDYDVELASVHTVNGELQTVAKSAAGLANTAGPAPRYWGSQAVDVDFVADQSEAYAGVICQAPGVAADINAPHYELTAAPIGAVRIDKATDGMHYEPLAGGSPASHPELMKPGIFNPPGERNHLRAECIRKGNRLELALYVNGKLGAKATDTSPLFGGGASLFTVGGAGATPPVTVNYDNFVLSDPLAKPTKSAHGAAATVPGGPSLFADPMKAPKPGEGFQATDTSSGVTRFTKGAFEVTALSGQVNGYTADALDKKVQDSPADLPDAVTVEVSAVKINKGHGDYGISCMAVTAGEAYYLGIDNDGFATIQKATQGMLVPLAGVGTRNADIKGGSAKNRIVGRCASNGTTARLQLIVNGHSVLTYEDATNALSPGSAGVFVSGSEVVTTRFSDFAVVAK